MTSGHAGEWIASMIFDIRLEAGAAHPGFDGHFQSGQLAGKTVNVKWYLRQEGVLDMTTSPTLHYYLVMTGPWHSATLDKTTRPWVIDYVYLFDAQKLLGVKQGQGVKIGIATGVRKDEWKAAEIYPSQTSINTCGTFTGRASISAAARPGQVVPEVTLMVASRASGELGREVQHHLGLR